MSGGQDPNQQDWEILTWESEETLKQLVKCYLDALDKSKMVLVYSLRSKMREVVAHTEKKTYNKTLGQSDLLKKVGDP